MVHEVVLHTIVAGASHDLHRKYAHVLHAVHVHVTLSHLHHQHVDVGPLLVLPQADELRHQHTLVPREGCHVVLEAAVPPHLSETGRTQIRTSALRLSKLIAQTRLRARVNGGSQERPQQRESALSVKSGTQ